MEYQDPADLYDLIYRFKDYASESDQIRSILNERAGRPVRTLLDVACGTGRHLEYLAAHYSVEGLDLDAHHLEAARRRMPGAQFHLGDMCAFDLGKRYDAVISLFGGVGYSRTPERLHATFRAMANHLSPGGILLVEPFLTPDGFKKDVPYAVFVDDPELKAARIGVSHLRGRLATLDFHYLIADPSGVRHFADKHELGLFTDVEYCEAIAAAGLELLQEDRTLTGRGLYVARLN